jgi:hypothetical protein
MDIALGRGLNEEMNYHIQFDVDGERRTISGTMSELHEWRHGRAMPSFYDDHERWVVASRIQLGQGIFRLVSAD